MKPQPIKWEVDLFYLFPDSDDITSTTILVEAHSGKVAIAKAKRLAPSLIRANIKVARAFIFPRDGERNTTPCP